MLLLLPRCCPGELQRLGGVGGAQRPLSRDEVRQPQSGQGAKERIVAAQTTDTVHTRVFDLALGYPWPASYPGRALRNGFTERWHGHEDQLPTADVQAQLTAVRKADDLNTHYVYAGQSAGLVHDVLPAAAALERLVAEAEQALQGAARPAQLTCPTTALARHGRPLTTAPSAPRSSAP